MVLLELLARSTAVHQQELLVAHIDHGLQPVTVPRGLVAASASRLGLPLRTVELHLPADATETDAREARLLALQDIAREFGAGQVFLAHHADDQAETVLMRAARGSGPAGLRGISRRRGIFLRPLLAIRRADLVAFAIDARMEWWEDPANRDPRHLRSWLRTEIIPRMEAQLPDLTPRLLQVAAHARRERTAWRQLLREWNGLEWREESGVHSLSFQTLKEMPDALRTALLGALAREAGCPSGPARLSTAWQSLATAGSGQRSDLGGGWKFEVAFDRLRLLAPPTGNVTPLVVLEAPAGALEWGGWQLKWSTEQAPAVQDRAGTTAWFDAAQLSVRPWRAGDRLRPLGASGRRLAVRCFQDARVPSSSRAGWPIFESRGDIAWIPGVCRSDLLLPVPGSASLRVEVSARE